MSENIIPGTIEVPQEPVVNRNADGTFGPGNNANPGGRPKGSFSIMNIIRKKMEEVPRGQTQQWKDQIAEIILDEAIVKRNPKMIQLIVEHMDGKAKQPIDIDVNEQGLGDLTALLRSVGKVKTDGSNTNTSEPTGAGTLADTGGSTSEGTGPTPV